MTVKEAIERLKQLPDHTMMLMIDCPRDSSWQPLMRWLCCVARRGRPRDDRGEPPSHPWTLGIAIVGQDRTEAGRLLLPRPLR